MVSHVTEADRRDQVTRLATRLQAEEKLFQAEEELFQAEEELLQAEENPYHWSLLITMISTSFTCC